MRLIPRYYDLLLLLIERREDVWPSFKALLAKERIRSEMAE